MAQSLRREPATVDHASLALRVQAFPQGLHRCSAGVGAGDFGRGRLAHVVRCGADGGDLVWQSGGPGHFGGGGSKAHVRFGLFAFGCRMACRVFVVGAQPADFAAGFRGRATAVQGDEALQDFVIVWEAGEP